MVPALKSNLKSLMEKPFKGLMSNLSLLAFNPPWLTLGPMRLIFQQVQSMTEWTSTVLHYRSFPKVGNGTSKAQIMDGRSVALRGCGVMIPFLDQQQASAVEQKPSTPTTAIIQTGWVQPSGPPLLSWTAHLAQVRGNFPS